MRTQPSRSPYSHDTTHGRDTSMICLSNPLKQRTNQIATLTAHTIIHSTETTRYPSSFTSQQMRLISTTNHSHLTRLDSTRKQTTSSTPINARLIGHHRRGVDANLPSLVLLDVVAGGTPRTAFVVPRPGPALIPLLALPPFVEEGDEVAGERSSMGGKRSLSMSDLRLSHEQVRYLSTRVKR